MDEDIRSGQRKFLKEISRVDEEKEMDSTESSGLTGHEGNTNPIFTEGASSSSDQSGNESVTTEIESHMDFEALYNHCKGEQTLLSQLNKMSDILKNSNLVGVDAQRSHNQLSLTPLVKTLFTANEGISAEHKDTNPHTKSPSQGRNFLGNINTGENPTGYYPIENNLFLRAIASSIDNMQNTLKQNSDSVSRIGSRMTGLEISTERSLQELSERVMITENNCIENKSAVGDFTAYVDEKVNVLKEAIPDTLAEVNRELETKVGTHEVAIDKIKRDLSKFPAKDSLNKFERTFLEKVAKLEKNSTDRMNNIETRVTKVDNARKADTEFLKNELDELKQKFATMEVEMSKQANEFRETTKSNEVLLDKLKATTNPYSGFSDRDTISRVEWQRQKSRADEFENRLLGLEGDMSTYKKVTDMLNIHIRKQNVLIDQLSEVENENTLARINGILDLTLTPIDRANVTISKAFRLGAK